MELLHAKISHAVWKSWTVRIRKSLCVRRTRKPVAGQNEPVTVREFTKASKRVFDVMTPGGMCIDPGKRRCYCCQVEMKGHPEV